MEHSEDILGQSWACMSQRTKPLSAKITKKFLGEERGWCHQLEIEHKVGVRGFLRSTA